MTDEKVLALKEIDPFNTVKETQYFPGFANFYRRFIKDYSKIVLPLTNSMAHDKKEWQTTLEIEKAQKQLIDVLTSARVVKYFNPDLATIVETDTSRFALGAILSQKYDGQLHPVVFQSRKFTQAVINYDTADEELLAIVDSFKRWRCS